MIGLTSSLLNLLRDVTLYHIVSDGEASNLRRQIKLVPYYLIHLAFRSLALATFFIYWKVSFAHLLIKHLDFAFKEYAIFTIVPLVIFNMWLTRRTYKLPTNSDEQHHLHFCTVVGGKSSKTSLNFTPRLVLLHGTLSVHIFWADNVNKELELSLQAQHLGDQPLLWTYLCQSCPPYERGGRERRWKSAETKPSFQLP